MGFDKVFTDGKTEAASLYFRAGNAEITVKDTLMVTRVNSFPKVLHEYFHFLVHLMRTDNDTAILRRVVDGVGKEVREYPGDLLTVYKELAKSNSYPMEWRDLVMMVEEIGRASCRERV